MCRKYDQKIKQEKENVPDIKIIELRTLEKTNIGRVSNITVNFDQAAEEQAQLRSIK